jgi:hypothetical protein
MDRQFPSLLLIEFGFIFRFYCEQRDIEQLNQSVNSVEDINFSHPWMACLTLLIHFSNTPRNSVLDIASKMWMILPSSPCCSRKDWPINWRFSFPNKQKSDAEILEIKLDERVSRGHCWRKDFGVIFGVCAFALALARSTWTTDYFDWSPLPHAKKFSLNGQQLSSMHGAALNDAPFERIIITRNPWLFNIIGKWAFPWQSSNPQKQVHCRALETRIHIVDIRDKTNSHLR